MFSERMLCARWRPAEPANTKTIDRCVKTVEGVARLIGAKAWQCEGSVWTGSRVPPAVKRGLASACDTRRDHGDDIIHVDFTGPGVQCLWVLPLRADSSSWYAWFTLSLAGTPSASRVSALIKLVADVWSPAFVATHHGPMEDPPIGFDPVHWDGRPSIGVMCYLQGVPPRTPRGVRIVPHGNGVIVRVGTGSVWSEGKAVVRKLDRLQQAMGLEPTIAYRWCRPWARLYGVKLAEEGGKRELTRTEAIDLLAKQMKRGLRH